MASAKVLCPTTSTTTNRLDDVTIRQCYEVRTLSKYSNILGCTVGWIVHDTCNRLYGEIGRYRWDQWRCAAAALGIEVVVIDSKLAPPACLYRNTICLRGGFDDETTAWLAWHELAHAVLHAGSPDSWRDMIGGVHLLNKFERQADEFAETFPVWEDP